MKFQEESKHIKLTKGWKYRLESTAYFKTSITGFQCKTKYITLHSNGWLEILEGYCYDGPSGPTIDTDDSLRGALCHDALYELMRKELLPQSCRKLADRELWRILREDDMDKYRANVWYYSVRGFAEDSADPSNIKEAFIVP